MADTDEPGLSTLYNGACPVCRHEMKHYRRVAAACGANLEWRDVAADPGPALALRIDPEVAKSRLHALDREGNLHVGVDALIAIWSALPSHRWIARLVGAPVVHPVARLAYDHLLAPTLYRWAEWRMRRAGAGRGRLSRSSTEE